MTKKRIWLTSWILATAGANTASFAFPNPVIMSGAIVISAITCFLLFKDIVRKK